MTETSELRKEDQWSSGRCPRGKELNVVSRNQCTVTSFSCNQILAKYSDYIRKISCPLIDCPSCNLMPRENQDLVWKSRFGSGCICRCVPKTLGPRLWVLMWDLLAEGDPLAHPQANGCSCETTESALCQWGRLWCDPVTQCLPLFVYSQ